MPTSTPPSSCRLSLSLSASSSLLLSFVLPPAACRLPPRCHLCPSQDMHTSRRHQPLIQQSSIYYYFTFSYPPAAHPGAPPCSPGPALPLIIDCVIIMPRQRLRQRHRQRRRRRSDRRCFCDLGPGAGGGGRGKWKM